MHEWSFDKISSTGSKVRTNLTYMKLFLAKLVEWTDYETSHATKKIKMLLCFMLCAGSRL